MRNYLLSDQEYVILLNNVIKTELQVIVGPNSKSNLVYIYDELIKIRLKSKAIRGKANIELVRFLALILEVSQSEIQIKYGLKSSTKLVEIQGFDEHQVMQKLVKYQQSQTKR